MISAMGLPAAWCTRVLSIAFNESAGVRPEMDSPTAAPAIPDGALAAGRWLRTHSGPNDVVAANTHCLRGLKNPCDSREFWVAALTERHVLVEGWAYTATNMRRWRLGERAETLPFWDEERLRLNDVVFRSPSAASIRQLHARYGVRWLFVDERWTNARSRLDDFANFRFRSGDYAVYQVSSST
jgi:hypothetical protein